MNRGHLWKLLLIVGIVAWAVTNVFPPTDRNLTEVFLEKSYKHDATFSNIVSEVKRLNAANPERVYGNLKAAIGTNDITRYFPEYDTKAEKEPTLFILNKLQKAASGRIRLGLDLRGGSSFLVEMKTNNLEVAGSKEMALERAMEVLRRRVDRFAVAEPLIQTVPGRNQILIQMPGLNEEDRISVRNAIQRTAALEFRLVHEDSAALLQQGIVPPGYEIKKELRTSPKDPNEKMLVPYLVRKQPVPNLSGRNISSAVVIRGLMNDPQISFRLDSEGAKAFGKVTSENVGKQLAILLDGELYSAPVIRQPILEGSGVISGGSMTDKDAFELANVLQNPLEYPVEIVEERAVDPSLGKDTIRSGVTAAFIGTIAVVLFMAIYYLLGGMVANFALVLNIVILLGVMCSRGYSFTLPGIAGIVLTIGMAVDANVLIFERIREELAAGKSLRGALEAGYGKAFGTILDSNVTTLIASIILWKMGTGPVEGFGQTLTIGVTVSMFTALVVTRLIFDFLLARNMIKSLRMLHIVRGARINFLRFAMPAFVASWLIILIGLGYGILGRGHEVFGVDFAGGDTMTLSFAKRVEVDKLRETINKLNVGEPLIQYQRDLAGGEETLRITTKYDTAAKVEQALRAQFPDAKFASISLDRVGPTVGAEIMKTAIIAALLGMFGILIYVAFRYEFSFAVGAVLAIVHDILMTLGVYFLSGRQLNATIVAAVLTIIGFSINDTIVIFDRIREDLKLGVKGSFMDVMNAALNQTLSRTIITSGTVFLATGALYLFGGGAINDFAFCFLVGILTGTYSSIFIASALVLWWHKGQRPAIGSTVSVEGQPATNLAAPAKA